MQACVFDLAPHILGTPGGVRGHTNEAAHLRTNDHVGLSVLVRGALVLLVVAWPGWTKPRDGALTLPELEDSLRCFRVLSPPASYDGQENDRQEGPRIDVSEADFQSSQGRHTECFARGGGR